MKAKEKNPSNTLIFAILSLLSLTKRFFLSIFCMMISVVASRVYVYCIICEYSSYIHISYANSLQAIILDRIEFKKVTHDTQSSKRVKTRKENEKRRKKNMKKCLRRNMYEPCHDV